jgi:ABC-type branched-subunit amino acid transport system substrate-binding protein
MQGETMIKRRLSWITSVIGASVLVTGVFVSVGGSVASAAKAPYVIGMSNDLSGPIAPSGQQGLAGLETYVQYLNSIGGVNGRKIDLVSLDDQSNPALGRSDYQELAEKKALVMFGCVYTSVCQAAAPLIKTFHVPIIAEGGPNNLLFPAVNDFYSNDLPQGAQTIAMAEEIKVLAAAEKVTNVKIAWIGVNTASDLDGITSLKAFIATQPGWSFVGEQFVPFVVTDASSEAQAIAADNPNFVVTFHNDANIIPVVDALRQAGVTAPVINPTAGSADSTFEALKGNFIAWRTYVSPSDTGIAAVATMLQRADKFHESKEAIGSYFTQGYVDGMIVQAALKKCGAKCNSGKQFNAALQTLHSFNSQGLSAGQLGFSKTRHVLNYSAWFFQWSATQDRAVKISNPITVTPAQIKSLG